MAKTPVKDKHRRLVLGAMDQQRIAALRKAMGRENAAVKSDADVIRVALAEAVGARGIGTAGERPFKAVDVERIEADVPNGHAGRSS